MQPTTKKARFTALETEDLDEIVNSAQAQRAKYQTKWGISVVEG